VEMQKLRICKAFHKACYTRSCFANARSLEPFCEAKKTRVAIQVGIETRLRRGLALEITVAEYKV